jgi:TatD DNase family protein
MVSASQLLQTLPMEAPTAPKSELRFADVAVTATAAEFKGMYRGKQYHQPDFDDVLERAQKANVDRILLTGMSLHDVEYNLSVARKYPEQCGITIGVHPYHAEEPDGDPVYMSRLSEAVSQAIQETPRLIRAFGELGLDYDRLDRASKEVQIQTFRAQLDMFVSAGWDLPLFLHCRAAFDDFVYVIEPYLGRLPRSGLVHSFVGTAAQMHRLVALGFDVSVNGFSFKDLESLQMVSEIPLAQLQIETDAPWGEVKDNDEVWRRYGVNYRNKEAKRKKKDKWEQGWMIKERNESCCIEKVAFVVAGSMDVDVDLVADTAYNNSMRMFWND